MVSRQGTHRVIREFALTAFAAATFILVAASPSVLAQTAGFENEATLQYSSFAGLPPRVGSDYQVVESVPVSGYYGQFTLKTEFGDIHADGEGLLKQRIKEIQPTIELQKMSTSKVFTDALGQSVKGGAASIGQAVAHPVNTVKNVPAGIGRFFKSVEKTVSGVTSTDGDGSQSAAVADAFGVNKAKRALAEKVGVDPYTTNPYLAKRLDSLANAAVAGGISVDVVLAVSTGGAAMIVSTTKTVSNLAWSLPPEDVRKRNDEELAAIGADSASRSKLLGNRWYTPTMALSFVEAMKNLDVREGASSFAELAAGAQSEIEARFYISQLRLARRFADEGNAIASMTTRGRIGAFITEKKGLFVPAALDYLTWTKEAQATIEAHEDPRPSSRTVWFTGKASPKAAEEIRRAGWIARFDVAPAG